MANEIFTRLQLKYDTLANWNLVKDTFKPLAGEVCIAKVEVNDPANKLLDPVMIKVGDGTSTWGQLDWISAKAADVYAWAKKAGIDVEVVDVEGNPEGDEHVEYPIVNFAWDSVNNKLVATKGIIDAAAINVNASNGSGFSGNVEEWLEYLNELMWDYSHASEQAHNQLFEAVFNNGNEDDPYVTDGSKTLIVTTDGESYNNHNAYTVKAVDIAITHDQVTDFDEAAVAAINTILDANDNKEEVTTSIIDLLNYINENAGDIEALVADVNTANMNASDAVYAVNSIGEEVGLALDKAYEAKEAANAATEAVENLHAIATSGSIYDVAEGSKVSTGTDTNVKYLVFNCGTASTVI